MGIYSFKYLEIMTDQDRLISENLEYQHRYLQFYKNFGDMEFLYIVVEVENNLEKAKKFVKTLAERIKNDKELNKDLELVLSQVKLELWNLLLLVDKGNLESILAEIKNVKENIKNFNKVNSLTKILHYINDQIDVKNKENDSSVNFIILNYILDEIKSSLEGKNYKSKLSILRQVLKNELDDNSFFVSDDKKYLYLMILPQKDYYSLSVIEKPLKRIRQIVSQTKKEFNIKAGITGRTVLQADEMTTTDNDMQKATIISIIGVTLLFIIFLRNITRPILAIITLFISIIITLGITALTIGYLNILSIAFAIIIIGLGIDFGVHIISRYHEALSKKMTVEEAIKNTLLTTGIGSITGALTTAVAFLIFLFVDFKGLSELGFIAGIGVLITLFSMLLLLPALFTLIDKNKPQEKLHATSLISFSFLNKLLSHSNIIIIFCTAISVLCLFTINNVTFNNNLLELHAEGLESVEYAKKSNEANWFVAFTVSSSEENKQIVSQLNKMKSIGKVETIETFISNEKINIISQLKKELDNLSLPKSMQKISLEELKNVLYKIGDKINYFRNKSVKSIYLSFIDPVKNLINTHDKLKLLLNKNKAEYILQVNMLQNNILKDITESYKLFNSVISFITKENLKNKLPKLIQMRMLERVPPQEFDLIPFQKEVLSKLEKDNIKIMSSICYHLDNNRSVYTLNEKLSERDKNNCLKLLKLAGYKRKQVIYAYPDPNKNIWDDSIMNSFVKDINQVKATPTGPIITVYETDRIIRKGFIYTAIFVAFIVMIFVYFDFRSVAYTLIALIPLTIGLLWLFGIMGLFTIHLNFANFFAIPILIGTGIDYGVHLIHRYREDSSNLDNSIHDLISESTTSAVILSALTTIIGFGSLMIASHKGMMSLGLILALGSFISLFNSIVLIPAILKLIGKKIKG